VVKVGNAREQVALDLKNAPVVSGQQVITDPKNIQVDPANVPAFDLTDQKLRRVNGVLTHADTGFSVEDYSTDVITMESTLAEDAATSSAPYPGQPQKHVPNTQTGGGTKALAPGVKGNAVKSFTEGADILRAGPMDDVFVGKGTKQYTKYPERLRGWGREWKLIEHRDANGNLVAKPVKMKANWVVRGGASYWTDDFGLSYFGLEEDPNNPGFSLPVTQYFDLKDAYDLDNDPNIHAPNEPGSPRVVSGTGRWGSNAYTYAPRFAQQQNGQGKMNSGWIRRNSNNVKKPGGRYGTESEYSPQVFLDLFNRALRTNDVTDWEAAFKNAQARIQYWANRREFARKAWSKADPSKKYTHAQHDFVFSGEQVELTHKALTIMPADVFDRLREAERSRRVAAGRARNRVRTIQLLQKLKIYRKQNRPIATGIDSEISPDVDPNGGLVRKRTPAEILDKVVEHQATGALDTTDISMAPIITLDDTDVDYLASLSEAFETDTFNRRSTGNTETTSFPIHAQAWDSAGYNDRPVIIHRDEIPELIAAKEADGTLAVLPIFRGLRSPDDPQKALQVDSFARGERYIPGGGGMMHGNGENFAHNPGPFGSYHTDGGSIVAFVPLSAEVMTEDDAENIKLRSHEALWALDYAFRQVGERGLSVRVGSSTKQIFDSTHGDFILSGTRSGSVDPTDITTRDTHVADLLLALRNQGYGTNPRLWEKRGARYNNQAVKERIDNHVERLVNMYVQLEDMYDRTSPMNSQENIKVRMAQRALMHADPTTIATLLGADVVVTDGAEDLANGEITTRDIFRVVRTKMAGDLGAHYSSRGGIGTINHINVLNRSAVIVSQDGWEIDEIIDIINDVNNPDTPNERLYDLRSGQE